MNTIIPTFELGCIFALLSLGLFISFKILNLPDLSVDGTFTLGCSVTAIFTINHHPFLGLVCGFIAGFIAGMICGILQTKLKIQNILAGILVMSGLYSINLRITGLNPTISLYNYPTVFTLIPNSMIPIVLFITVSKIALLMIYFFKTQFGLALRASGDNEDMVRNSSINTDFMRIIGLALSNGLVALSGGILAQYQSYCDVNSGIGMMVIALASIMIGDALIHSKKIHFQIFACILGAILYRYLFMIALQINISVSDLKLLSALLVILAISLSQSFKGGNPHVENK